jgi:hypothetical protein
MSEHTLFGRTENELLWFKRRSFVQAAAAWTAMGGFTAAVAQQRSNVVELRGDALVNGERLRAGQFIQTGDQIQTGPDSHLVFALGNAAFQVRQNSRFVVERGATLNAVSVLRMLTGAIVSVWNKGNARQIVTPTLTAGIRGTGVYTEVFPERNYRSYFCNCYGVVDMSAGGDRVVSTADYHQSFWGEPQPVNGRLLTPARAINHSDEEVEMVARLVGERTAWEIAGKKGTKDGTGYMDTQPGQVHPLMQQQPAPPPQPAPRQ